MKKKGKAEDGRTRAEYDFSKGRKNPYAERANTEMSVVLVEPELYRVFAGDDAVNEALRLIVKASAKAVKSKAVKQNKAS